MTCESTFDVCVVGAGHAGCEAALAAGALGCHVLLVTLSLDRVAAMSCNPAIGGIGKGHLVKEIDAMGGVMGLAADHSGIQFRTLNRSKGPAVRGTRAQSDMRAYSAYLTDLLRHRAAGVTCVQGEVTAVLQRTGVFHVVIDGDLTLAAKTVVLTTGTFLDGLLHTGPSSRPGGRLGDPASLPLSSSLRALGLRLGRLKTGTCPRLDGKTIDFAALEKQWGDDPPPLFSFLSLAPRLPQRPCHITYTNSACHNVVRMALDRSPLFCGIIKGRGPRYCPSIEDKVVRFPDRDRHQVFLEPEGLNTDEYYPNGLSTSLPEDVQIRMVRSIRGLEEANVNKFGYAVEYDFVDPVQLLPSLVTKRIPGLFCAGQINGTSGYEEAAAQGLMAGINAARLTHDQPPVVLRRDNAYIGVMIDDLVTVGTAEPYRMFTARAEHRMLLREDNADVRLTPVGREIGLVGENRWEVFKEKERTTRATVALLRSTRIKGRGTAEDCLKRPGVSCKEVLELLADVPRLSPAVENTVEILVKFEGYIRRERQRLERISRMEGRVLPDDLDYAKIAGLSSEAVEKLSAVRPLTLGQASRIPGMTPAAISMIVVHLAARGTVSHET